MTAPLTLQGRLIKDLPMDVELTPQINQFTHAMYVAKVGEHYLVGVVPKHMDFNTTPDVIADKDRPAAQRACFKLRESVDHIRESVDDHLREKARNEMRTTKCTNMALGRARTLHVKLRVISISGDWEDGWCNAIASMGGQLSARLGSSICEDDGRKVEVAVAVAAAVVGDSTELPSSTSTSAGSTSTSTGSTSTTSTTNTTTTSNSPSSSGGKGCMLNVVRIHMGVQEDVHTGNLAGLLHTHALFQDDAGDSAGRDSAGGFDLLLCNTNILPDYACEIAEKLAPHLVSGAAVVLTIKMNQKGEANAERLETRLRAQLQAGMFDRVELRWLLANSRHERTLFCCRK
jgi:hypothetical protein